LLYAVELEMGYLFIFEFDDQLQEFYPTKERDC